MRRYLAVLILAFTALVAVGCDPAPQSVYTAAPTPSETIPRLDEAAERYEAQQLLQRVLWLTTYARQRQIDGAKYAAATRPRPVHVRHERPREQVVTHPVPSVGYGVWDRLAQCEASGNWAANTGNGFSGGLQFTPSTWRSYGGTGMAWQNSREAQIAVAERVLAGQGWGAWPACSRRLGLR